MRFARSIIHPDAKLPIRGSEGAAGLDLYAIQDETVTERVTIINTGIGVKIPKGHYGHVCPRSSLALKGVTVLAGVGATCCVLVLQNWGCSE
uniref:dUTP diphosphatase n=1 Tax=Erpetoichthys calabaricus TaxID=27687 RepID=A0A8C4XFV6_ERPCA